MFASTLTFLLFLLLPTYLLRFHIFGLPSTVLEIIILTLVALVFVQHRQNLLSTTKELWRTQKILVIGTLLFLAGATISVFTAVSLRAALGEWRAFYVEPILVAIAIFLMLQQWKRDGVAREKVFFYILLPLLISGVLTSLLSIYQHFTGWLVPYSFWENRNTYRVTAWYGFPNGVGLFLAPLFPLALFALKAGWKEKQPAKRWLLLSTATLFILVSPLAIIYAKTTAALVGLAGGLGYLLISFRKTRAPVVVLGILLIATIFGTPQLKSVQDELLARDRSGQLRRDMWHETQLLLQDHPFAGAGLASYEERILPYRQDRSIEVFHHPHNLFLTIWVNTGLVGFLGFFLLTIWVIKQAWTLSTEKNKRLFPLFVASALGVIFVTGLVDSPYIKNDWAVVFWGLITLLCFSTEKKS